MKNLKVAKSYVCLAFIILAVVLLVIFWFLQNMNSKHTRDVKDTSVLKEADPIAQKEEELELVMLTDPVDMDTVELSLELRNAADLDFDLPLNEIVIDRYLDGKWYFWGISGNAYEVGNGVQANEKGTFSYHLAGSSLLDADYIETYDGEITEKNGELSYREKERRIIFFPGRYRIRMEGSLGGGDSEKKKTGIMAEVTVK